VKLITDKPQYDEVFPSIYPTAPLGMTSLAASDIETLLNSLQELSTQNSMNDEDSGGMKNG